MKRETKGFGCVQWHWPLDRSRVRNKIQSKAYNNIIMMIINDDDDNMNIILNTISEKRKEKSIYLLYGHKYLINNNTKIDS